jgi:diguanylate cyclase (GGDEF)-like protein
MEKKRIHILIIAENPQDTILIKNLLAETETIRYSLDSAATLSGGLELLVKNIYDLILLGLSLPDSHGLETLNSLSIEVLEVPVIILTGLDDEVLAICSLQNGAQDYLVKEKVSRYSLIHAINYAIERNQLQLQLKEISNVDVLTKLYNRRGFLTLSEQQFKLAKRKETDLCLFFIDINNMKKINDQFGHMTGDAALVGTAGILRKVFRESDIIARIGGDEFAVLAIGSTGCNVNLFTERVNKYLAEFNAWSGLDFPLSISIGVSHNELGKTASIEEMLANADKLMYQQKKTAEFSPK